MAENPFTVAVVRDWTVTNRDFYMGLDVLLDNPDFDVTFLRAQADPVRPLRSEELRGTDALVSLVDDINEASLGDTDELRIIAKYGAGFDNIDLEACTKRGIPVTNAPQAPTESVAQATLGLLIATAHNFKAYDEMVRASGFEGPILENFGTVLFDKIVGVVGFGRIGHRLAELLEPFDVTIQVYDPYLDEAVAEGSAVSKVDKDSLLETSDFISLHCPLTEETAGMLTEEDFRRMKSTARLVNTTRGGLYDDADLAKAVREGWIAGAGVDVFEDESDVGDNPLLNVPGILATPHIAGLTLEALTKYGDLCVEAVQAVRKDEVPRNVLNPDAFDRGVPAEKCSPSFRT